MEAKMILKTKRRQMTLMRLRFSPEKGNLSSHFQEWQETSHKKVRSSFIWRLLQFGPIKNNGAIKSIVLAVWSTLMLLLSQVSAVQAQTASGQTVKSPLEVAKMIAEQGRTVSLRQSKTEVKIEKKDLLYQFREGESRAVLVKLPEYAKPYVLRIFSGGSGFMTIHAFAPIAVVLDSEFAQLDKKVEFASRIGNKRKVFVTEIKLDDAWRNARYLFFYTDGSAVGKEAARDVGGTTTVQGGPYTVTNLPVLDVVFRRGATGRLKFEISHDK